MLGYNITSMQAKSYTAVIQYDAGGGVYVGSIPALPGCYTQGATLDELRANLREAMGLMVEFMQARGEELPEDVPDVRLEKLELAS